MSALSPRFGVVLLAPSRQKYPAPHNLYGVTRPHSSQTMPPVHVLQSDRSSMPVLLLKVPGGHLNSSAYLVPSGQ